MRFRHWFWDFDGTLFNTYPRICRAFQKSLADAGIFEEISAIYPIIKQSLNTAAESFGTANHVPPQALLDGYRRHSEEEDLSTMLPYPGMRAFLVHVTRLGGLNYLYTHRGESVFKALDHEDLNGLFSDMVTSLDGFPAKPAPDALLYLISKHSLCPDDCVMVGDRVIDIEAGQNAGMHALCMDPDGYCPRLDGVPAFRDYQTLTQYIDAS